MSCEIYQANGIWLFIQNVIKLFIKKITYLIQKITYVQD